VPKLWLLLVHQLHHHHHHLQGRGHKLNGTLAKLLADAGDCGLELRNIHARAAIKEAVDAVDVTTSDAVAADGDGAAADGSGADGVWGVKSGKKEARTGGWGWRSLLGFKKKNGGDADDETFDRAFFTGKKKRKDAMVTNGTTMMTTKAAATTTADHSNGGNDQDGRSVHLAAETVEAALACGESSSSPWWRRRGVSSYGDALAKAAALERSLKLASSSSSSLFTADGTSVDALDRRVRR
jgi:hypothetical protein